MRGQNIVSLGNDPLMQALELISDPVRFKKALDEIKREQKKLEDRIALAGTADEIVKKEARIDHELTEARAATNTAREEAKHTLEKATEKAERTIAKAQSEAADMTESAQAVLADAQRRLTASREQFANNKLETQALTQREQQIQNQEKILEKRIAEIDELETQLLQEKSKLATVSETLKQAVG